MRRTYLTNQLTLHPSRQISVAIFVLLFVISGTSALAQTKSNTPANSSQAKATPTPEPTPIPLSAIVTQAEAVTARLRAIRGLIAEKQGIQGVKTDLPSAIQQIERDEAESAGILSEDPPLEELRTLETIWQTHSRKFSTWKSTLEEQIAVLEKNIGELDQLSKVWRLSLVSMQKPATDEAGSVVPGGSSVPDEILQKTNETIVELDEVKRHADESLKELLSTRNSISELDTRVRSIRDEIRATRNRALTSLFVAEAGPIWAPQEQVDSPSALLYQATGSFSEQMADLKAYVATRGGRFALQGLIFILIAAGLFWARSRIQPFVDKEPKLEKAAQIFALPIATGLILTITLSSWFYPQAPRMLGSLAGAAALVPVVLLLRRMVDRPLFTILNTLVILYFVDRLREILVNQPFAARILFLAEMLGAILFLVWFLKSKWLSAGVEAAHYRLFTNIKKIIPIALAIFAVAFVAGILGFANLAYLIGNGVLGSAYLGLVIYTAIQIVRGLIIFALRVPPLAGMAIVKNNRPIIRERSVKIVRWLGAIIWVFVTLNLFSIRQTIFGFVRSILAFSVNFGTIEISVGSVVLFALTIWIAVLISRFLRFLLEEDVYPRVDIGGGVSYAVSTMLHYSILIIGFMIAVGALGFDFTKLAIVAGAVGIGIGFGLQNIVNNFISGLILLFERPVKVGDVVQLDLHMGTLQHIGLRASVLRKVDGSDVIVPNSMLVSEAVTNWTMSDKERRIDIPVGVAYGTDPHFVIELLKKVATSTDGVLTDPGPKGMFIGFGASALDFELRAWTDESDGWVQLRSNLVTGIHDALKEANIEIPFPQQDLHVRSVERSIVDEIARDNNSRRSS